MANSIEKLEIKPASSIAVFLGKSFPLAEREFAEQEVPRIRGALLIKGRQIAADLEITDRRNAIKYRVPITQNFTNSSLH